MEQFIEDFNDSEDKFLSHLLDDTSNASKTHVLELTGVTLDNLEDHLDAAVNHSSKNDCLIVNQTLPNLTRLSVDLLDGVVFEDEHTAENSLLGFLVNVGWGSLDDVILELLNELEHQDGRALTDLPIRAEHHLHHGFDELHWGVLSELLNANLNITH